MASHPIPAVEMIPIGLITVVNPRVRSKQIFKAIVANIAELGLKRPVTVGPARASEWAAIRAGLRPG